MAGHSQDYCHHRRCKEIERDALEATQLVKLPSHMHAGRCSSRSTLCALATHMQLSLLRDRSDFGVASTAPEKFCEDGGHWAVDEMLAKYVNGHRPARSAASTANR